MKSIPRIAVPAVGLVLTLGLVGACGGSADRVHARAARSATTSTTPAAPRSTAAPTRPSINTPTDLASAVALTQVDLAPGTHLELSDHGDVVEGEVTMDYCDGDFPSESERIARLQLAVMSAQSEVASNETVVYRDDAAAQQAMDELRAAVAGCPADRSVGSPVAGVPPARYDTHTASESGLVGLAADHVAIEGTITSEGGDTRPVGLVYQRRGRILSAVYGTDVKSLSASATAIARKLAALTPGQAGD